MKTILSGMRPSGKLHIGHLFGVLENWRKLQDSYRCYFEVADWHAMTTEYRNPRAIRQNTLEMVKDWLAAGIDPERAVIFVQSRVPEHTELHIVFSMLVSLSRLLRNPTFKEYVGELKAKELKTSGRRVLDRLVEQTLDRILEVLQQEQQSHLSAEEYRSLLRARLKETVAEGLNRLFHTTEGEELSYGHLVNYGFLGYPVLQAADILLYKGEVVPVGEDQVPHIELTREIARRFNEYYAPIFPVPEPLLTRFPRVPGTDGKRMSKSRGNTILISEKPEDLAQKVRRMITDPQKIRRGDPGRPEICPVFALHQVFGTPDLEAIERDCRSGALGCVDCKKKLLSQIQAHLEPLQEKRAGISDQQVVEILEEGSRRAREVARRTMAEVHEALGLF